jgi:hypothetical protein
LQKPSNLSVISIGSLFSLHSLTKSNCFLINLCLIGLLSILQILKWRQKESILACKFIGLNIICIFILWLYANQHLKSLPSFIYSTYHFCSGYSSMALYEPINYIFGPLALVLILISLYFASPALSVTIHNPRILNQLCLFIGLTAIIFFVWKHSFVRADGHMAILMSFLPIIISLIWIKNKNESIKAL